MSPAFRVLPVIVLMMTSYAVAADSPQKRYNIDIGCAAYVQESIAQNALPTNITALQAQPVGVVFAKRAVASGQAIGYSPERVSSAIANLRNAMLKRLSNPSAAKANEERTLDADMVTKCAAVYGYEVEQSVMGSR